MWVQVVNIFHCTFPAVLLTFVLPSIDRRTDGRIKGQNMVNCGKSQDDLHPSRTITLLCLKKQMEKRKESAGNTQHLETENSNYK